MLWLIIDRLIGSLIVKALRNEVDSSDQTDHSAEAPLALSIVVLSALHVMCCGVVPLLLSGVTAATILSFSPLVGGIIVLLGSTGFVWHVKKRGAARSVRCGTTKVEPQGKRYSDLVVVVGAASNTR